MYQYMTIEQCFLENGYRHFEKALFYKEAGYPDRFYEGSMRKARRWFKKANLYKLPEEVEVITEMMIKAYTFGIAFGIMNSDGTYTPLDNFGLGEV